MQLSTRTQRYVSSLFSSFVFSLYFVKSSFAQIIEWTEANGCVVDASVSDASGATTQLGNVATIQGIECLVTNILASATTFIGLAAFVMLIVGGFLFLTSGDSSKGTDAGKQTITYAIIGIIVALMAFFILQLVAGITGSRAFLQFNLNIGN